MDRIKCKDCGAESFLDEKVTILCCKCEKKLRDSVESDSSGCSVQPMVIPVIEDAFTIIEIISEINEIAEIGILPDGDSVNESTILWAEDAIIRFKDKYTVELKKV